MLVLVQERLTVTSLGWLKAAVIVLGVHLNELLWLWLLNWDFSSLAWTTTSLCFWMLVDLILFFNTLTNKEMLVKVIFVLPSNAHILWSKWPVLRCTQKNNMEPGLSEEDSEAGLAFMATTWGLWAVPSLAVVKHTCDHGWSRHSFNWTLFRWCWFVIANPFAQQAFPQCLEPVTRVKWMNPQ